MRSNICTNGNNYVLYGAYFVSFEFAQQKYNEKITKLRNEMKISKSHKKQLNKLKAKLCADEENNDIVSNNWSLPAFFPTSISMKPPFKYIIICCLWIWLIWTICVAMTATTNYISATYTWITITLRTILGNPKYRICSLLIDLLHR